MKLEHLPLFLIFPIFMIGCNPDSEGKTAVKDKSAQKIVGTTKAKVTFVELGSVNCIPCRAMQPVMKALEKEYGPQLEIIFYDVWQPEQRHYAQQYHIRVIPTQVFLDEKGEEFHRHEGFYPKEEIEKLLLEKKLKKKERSFRREGGVA